MKKNNVLLLILFQFIFINSIVASEKIPLVIEKNVPGAPQLLGIPFPKDKLQSSDHIRVLNAMGEEIPSQITIVNTWEPASTSVKWIWVFFFSDTQNKYSVEFGSDVVRKEFMGDRIIVENNQRPYGRVRVNTGPLQFTINKLGGGFLDKVELDIDRNGFGEKDLIAESSKTKGSFLNILDQSGIDTSRVKITHTVQEKGSGPLHAIIRIEGDYLYNKKDNKLVYYKKKKGAEFKYKKIPDQNDSLENIRNVKKEIYSMNKNNQLCYGFLFDQKLSTKEERDYEFNTVLRNPNKDDIIIINNRLDKKKFNKGSRCFSGNNGTNKIELIMERIEEVIDNKSYFDDLSKKIKKSKDGLCKLFEILLRWRDINDGKNKFRYFYSIDETRLFFNDLWNDKLIE